jgi:hypothetical protein
MGRTFQQAAGFSSLPNNLPAQAPTQTTRSRSDCRHQHDRESKVEADQQDLHLHCFSGLLVSKFAFSLRRVGENTVIRTITVFPEDQIRPITAMPAVRRGGLQAEAEQNEAESLTAMSVPLGRAGSGRNRSKQRTGKWLRRSR